MKKRLISFVMALVMVFTMLPVNAFAVTTDGNGTTVYEIGDSVWVQGEDGMPTEVTAPGTFWLPDYDENDQPVTRQGVCTKTEHTHVSACPEDCQLAHEHTDSCYTLNYTGCTIHVHDDSCVTESVYTCGKELHENHDNCGSTQVCSLQEHDHAAMNCPTDVRFTCGKTVHTSHDGCPTQVAYSCGQEHEHDLDACGGTVTVQCGMELHEHSVEAGCSYETEVTCGQENHSHSEGACALTTVYDCGKEIHTHSDCATSVRYVNCTEHAEHNETCAAEKKLTCTIAEHVCVTEGCPQDCTMEEHVHGPECDADTVYYRWTVVEDTSADFASEKGLPIRFFIALPGEASDFNGEYENYRANLWGTTNGSTGAYANADFGEDKNEIYTQVGIRNESDEQRILKHVNQWPAGYDANTFKDFGSMTIDGVVYEQGEYEIKWVTICYRKNTGWGGNNDDENYPTQTCTCWGYTDPHIHIDGVLTKIIQPAQLKLTKAIPEDQTLTFDETFKFDLKRLNLNADNEPIDPDNGVDTTFGDNGKMELTATIRAGETTADITGTGEIGFGYYMLTEQEHVRWKNDGAVVKNTGGSTTNYPAGPLFILIATDGTLRYSTTYNGTYNKAEEITINNVRKPYQVTYEWEGIPEGLTNLPEADTNIQPGGEHQINVSFKLGTRIMDTENGKYYVFTGWEYYQPENGARQYITYDADGKPSPSRITDIRSDIVIHGRWTEHELKKANGYITISKSFENKPADASFSNFYITVLRDNERYDITPSMQGTWNSDKTFWSYEYPITESGTYTVLEGKYDLMGYNVDKKVTVTPVTGLSTEGDEYTSDVILSDGHSYAEFGQKVEVTLPYDTAAADGAAGQSETLGLHAATVAFTNTYEKRTGNARDVLPTFTVRKWDGDFLKRLPNASFTLTDTADAAKSYSLTTNADGSASLADLPAGTYTLKETEAPAGYWKDDTVYAVTVEPDGDPVEKLEPICNHEPGQEHANACYGYVPEQAYKITVKDESGVEIGSETSTSNARYNATLNRLNIPNQQIRADLKISKTFYNATDSAAFTPEAGSIMVDIYPVTYNGNVPSIGDKLTYNDLIIDKTDDWTLTVTDLPYGHYFLEETMASIHGFNWTGATFNGEERVKIGDHYGTIVKVEGATDLSLTIQNEYTEWTAADFFIQKTDIAQNDLAGAKFQLFDGNTNVTGTYLDKQYSSYDAATDSAITNSNGVIHFTGFTLEDGQTSKSFTLKEYTAPNGYYLNSETFTVTVTLNDGVYDIKVNHGNWDHDDDFLTVYNTPILGKITVNKTVAGDTIPENASATFTVASTDGKVTKTATITKNDKWTHTFTDLPLGSYTVTETNASVPGYTYTTTHSVNGGTATQTTAASVTLLDNSDHKQTEGLPAGAKATVDFTNTYDRQEVLTVNPAGFSVYKRDEEGNALAGATFTLYTDEACQTVLSGVPFAVNATTDSTGVAHFVDLKLPDRNYGDYAGATKRSKVYYLKESTAPQGYVPVDTVWKITLDEDIKVEKLNSKNVFETVVDWISGLFDKQEGGSYEWVEGDTLAVVNKRIKGTLNITKEFNGVDNADKSKARIEIHVHGPITRDANNQITDIGNLVQVIELQGGETTAELPNLEVGEYVLRETFASIHAYTWNGVTYKVNGVTKATEKLQSNDTAEFVSFEITDDESAPEVNVTLTNTYEPWEKADFTIFKYKKDGNTNTGLGGAVFALYDKDQKEIQSVTTGIAGYATFSNLEVPSDATDVTYTLKEVTAPDNCYPVTTAWTVKITKGESGYNVDVTSVSSGEDGKPGWNWVDDRDTLWVENEEILGRITIKKEFTAKPDSLEEIKVNLIRQGGSTTPITLNSGNNWEYVASNLPMGTYYVVEQDANVPGYTLTTQYKENDVLETVSAESATAASYATVILDEGADRVAPNVSVEIHNTYAKQVKVVQLPVSFTILKKSSETEEPLANAIFALYDDNGNQVGDNLVTGEDGKVVVEELKLTAKQYSDYQTWSIGDKSNRATYKLVEIDAPAGYKRSTQEWEVNLSEELISIETVDVTDNQFFAQLQTILESIIGKLTNSNASADNANNLLQNNVLTVYNDPIKGSLSITKTYVFNDENDVLLADDKKPNLTGTSVTFHAHGPIQWNGEVNNPVVTDMGSEHILNLENGVLTGTIQNLPLGDYLVHETFASVHGFDWVTGGTFTNGNDTVTIEHNNTDYTYYLYHVTENDAEGSNPVSVTVTNTYTKWQAADFWIHKTDPAGNDLEGAQFQLYSDPSCTDEYKVMQTEGGPTVSATTGSDGLAHFSNFVVALNESVIYYVKESKAPEHFQKNPGIWKVTISHNTDGYELEIDGIDDDSIDDATDTITVVNKPILGKLTIRKDFDGDEIKAPADPDALTINVQITGPGNYNNSVNLTAENKWEATLDNLALGTYTVTEDRAKATVKGYDLLATTYSVQYGTADAESNENSNTSTAAAGHDVTFTDDNQNAVVTVTNTYDRKEAVVNNPDQFTILKTDDTGRPLPGAEFALTNDHNPSDVRYFTTGADGMVVVDGLVGNGTVTGHSDRTYTLEEIKAPAGHVLGNISKWKIDVKEKNGDISVELNEENNTYETVWDWILGLITPLSRSNEQTLNVVNPREATQLSVTKSVKFTGLTDADKDEMVKTLKNAKYSFELYIDGKLVETIQLSAGETKSFETKLPYGSSYEVKEIVPKNAAFSSKLSANASGTVTEAVLDGISVEAENTYAFQDEDELLIDMVKVSSGIRRKPLSGAEFALYNDENTAIGRYKSDNDGKFQIGQIKKPGTYTLKETKAPSGYYALKSGLTIEAEYQYTVIKDTSDKPVIIRKLVAEVSGRGVYDIDTNTYGIKNTRITDNPSTADQFDLGRWVGILLTAAAGLFALVVVGKKKFLRR